MVTNAGRDPSEIGGHLGLVEQAPEKRLGGDRTKIMIPATITCPDEITFVCVIRDMSITGARLSVSRRHRLPPNFSITIPGSGRVYPVHLAWQRADFAGVALAAPPEP